MKNLILLLTILTAFATESISQNSCQCPTVRVIYVPTSTYQSSEYSNNNTANYNPASSQPYQNNYQQQQQYRPTTLEQVNNVLSTINNSLNVLHNGYSLYQRVSQPSYSQPNYYQNQNSYTPGNYQQVGGTSQFLGQ